MGPHLSPLADLIGPSTVKSTERSGTTLADLRSSRLNGEGFDSYLERARSAGEPARVDDGEEPVPAKEHQDADRASDTTAGDREPAVAEQSQSAMPVDTIGQPPSTTIDPVNTGAGSVGGTADGTVAGSNGEALVKQGSSGSEATQPPATDTAMSQANAEAKAGQSASLLTQATTAMVESDAGNQAASASGRLNGSGGEGEAGVAKSTASGESQSSASKATGQAKQDGHALANANTNTNAKLDTGAGTHRESAQASTAGGGQTETETAGEAGRRASRDEDQSQQKQGHRESFFDLKIKGAIEAQRQGSTGERNADSSSGGGNGDQRNTAGDTSGNTRLSPTSLDNLRDIKSVSIRQSSGDAGATSIAKFLINGSGLSQLSAADAVGITSSQTATSMDGGGTFSTSGTTVTGTASATSAASTTLPVSGMLAAGMEATNSLAETAEVLRAAGGAGRQQVTLKLDPPELGQVRIQVQMRNQGMSLQINAETQVAGKLLESRISELRNSLAVQGIRLERAEIVVRSPETGEPGQQHQNDNRQANGDREQWQAGESNDGWAQGERTFTEQDDASLEGDTSGVSQGEMVDGVEPGVGEEAGILNTMPMAELSVDLVA